LALQNAWALTLMPDTCRSPAIATLPAIGVDTGER
jgi:hypothetical protein